MNYTTSEEYYEYLEELIKKYGASMTEKMTEEERTKHNRLLKSYKEELRKVTE